MKVIDFEAPYSKETRESAINEINKGTPFVIIYKNQNTDRSVYLTYQWCNMHDLEVIAALEIIKATHLRDEVLLDE
jgi:hypothetical protein